MLLSVLHLKQDGGRSTRNAGRHDTHTASDGDDIEARGLKEIKENYKEINGRSENVKKIQEMKASLVAKMTMKDRQSTNRN
jgi:hypothetical protein